MADITMTGADWKKEIEGLDAIQRGRYSHDIKDLLNWPKFKEEWGWTGLATLQSILDSVTREKKIAYAKDQLVRIPKRLKEIREDNDPDLTYRGERADLKRELKRHKATLIIHDGG